PELALLGTRCFSWPTTALPEIGTTLAAVHPVTWLDLVIRNYLATSSVVVRREVLDRAGAFDTQMQGPEDRDLWLRVAELAPIANLDHPLMGYRDVPGSVSKQARTCEASMLRIIRKLDRRKSWRGRWLLRRKATSFVHHTCSEL